METNHYIKPGNGIMTYYTSALLTTSIAIKRTTSRNIRSSSSNDGLAALVNKLDNLGQDMKKYGEFGRTTPFNGNNGGKFRVGSPGYYSKTDNRPPYGERRQSLEELLAKHQEESVRRSTKIEVWIKKLQENAEINTRNQNASLKNLETQIDQLTKELHSRNIKSKQAKDENTNDQLPTKNIFKYLELTTLSETEMLVEMADMRKKAPLGIVRDILVKIDKFLFPSDFVILDQTPKSTVILGRPFLATVHAQISVFEKEILVGIGDERVTFNINRNDHNFAPTEGIFMLNSINTDDPITKRLKISDDTTTTYFCKPIIQECDKDFKAWPSCSPFRNKCDGGMKFIGSMSLVKQNIWVFPNNNEKKEMKGSGVSFLNFLMIRYGCCQVEDSVWSESGENNETLSLGRKNGSRFRKMIMEEMKEVLRNDEEDSNDET
ncbi:DNA-binding pseudobarrel domain-containing protein [Tanacetum coccineum]|uniref:DNA-binding pseudobarrel domain-containing protein n=1 Tax=Tanacetum coccineum TaxID=301880 RepID=A0ABQ5ERT9_9ASTR